MNIDIFWEYVLPLIKLLLPLTWCFLNGHETERKISFSLQETGMLKEHSVFFPKSLFVFSEFLMIIKIPIKILLKLFSFLDLKDKDLVIRHIYHSAAAYALSFETLTGKDRPCQDHRHTKSNPWKDLCFLKSRFSLTSSLKKKSKEHHPLAFGIYF